MVKGRSAARANKDAIDIESNGVVLMSDAEDVVPFTVVEVVGGGIDGLGPSASK